MKQTNKAEGNRTSDICKNNNQTQKQETSYNKMWGKIRKPDRLCYY